MGGNLAANEWLAFCDVNFYKKAPYCCDNIVVLNCDDDLVI
jgi:hypothetical protein